MKSLGAARKYKNLDPVWVLKNELAERCDRNPRYSLRAFAKSMGISHTVLSLVITGKRKLSKKAALKVANYLALDPETREQFVDLGKRRHVSKEYCQLSMDSFAVISDWYPFAILSLLETSGAKFEASWISSRLGISVMQAKIAMERLERLELVAKSPRTKRYRQSGKPLKIENSETTQIARRYNKQVIEKSLESLQQEDMESHDFSSMTFALDPKHIPYARERIRAFRRELVEELESKGAPKEVYQLAVQIFPVSRLNAQTKETGALNQESQS